MVDFATDTSTGDILLLNNDFHLVKGVDAIQQSLAIRLRFFAQEWFLDEEAGVPYYEEILIKNPNVPNIESILKREILETKGIKELVEFDTSFNNVTYELTVSFKCNTIFGPLDFLETIFVGSP